VTDKYECLFCNADRGRVLIRRPAANICDKCVIVLVDDIGKEASSEYVRGLVATRPAAAVEAFAEIQAVVKARGRKLRGRPC